MPLDELDRPRTIEELAAWLRGHGETISPHTLWRWARAGLLPVARVGRMTSTARAYYAARAPAIGAD